jgi:hypothetical protein
VVAHAQDAWKSQDLIEELLRIELRGDLSKKIF